MCRALNPCHDLLIAMNNCYNPKPSNPCLGRTPYFACKRL